MLIQDSSFVQTLSFVRANQTGWTVSIDKTHCICGFGLFVSFSACGSILHKQHTFQWLISQRRPFSYKRKLKIYVCVDCNLLNLILWNGIYSSVILWSMFSSKVILVMQAAEIFMMICFKQCRLLLKHIYVTAFQFKNNNNIVQTDCLTNWLSFVDAGIWMKFNLLSSKPIQNSWTIWSTWRRDVSIPDMENFSHELAYHLVSFLTFSLHKY